MDHIRKALEKSQADTTVRDWMQPAAGTPEQNPPKPVLLTDDSGAAPAGSFHLNTELLRDNRIITAENTSSPLIDRYRLLRTRVQQIMKPRGWSVLGITSPTPQAGKSVTTMNLAIAAARAENQFLVVIDADLRRPRVASLLGLENQLGIVDFLRGYATLAEVQWQFDNLDNLMVIPGRPSRSLEHPSELLGSSRFESLVRQLRAMGKQVTVIVDTPPLHLGDDVLSIAPALDCVLLVLEEGKSTRDEVEESARLLSDYNLIGTVLNKASEKPKKFESYYQSDGDDLPAGKGKR